VTSNGYTRKDTALETRPGEGYDLTRSNCALWYALVTVPPLNAVITGFGTVAQLRLYAVIHTAHIRFGGCVQFSKS
jgi:hypothetical protein